MQSPTARFRTEIEFCLPKGYLDAHGVLHRQGVMRLATAADEILPLREPAVQDNPAYLAVVVLGRVIVKLGTVQDIDARMVEKLFASDFDYLQRLYEDINSAEEGAARIPASSSDEEAGRPLTFRAVGEA
jgi:hypothetical protein